MEEKVYWFQEERPLLAKAKLAKIAALVFKAMPQLRRGVEINFVTSAHIKKLNRLYRGLNKTTDVLSFAWGQAPGPALGEAPSGTVYLAPKYIRAQAKRFGVSSQEEFTRSFIHGLLHVGGYDHIKHREARKMFMVQEKLVAKAEKL